MPGMKRTKKFIDALKVVTGTPSKTISESLLVVLRDGAQARDGDWQLIRAIVTAVVGDAEDMEKPAKGEEAKS